LPVGQRVDVGVDAWVASVRHGSPRPFRSDTRHTCR
jgi:hypothetical protein